MKVAVYAIGLNEEQFVARWAESAKDADYICLTDTGSTDNTVKIAKKLGVKVTQSSTKPWRFDDARNVSLAVIPDDVDYCIALDLDEVLLPGWREELEKALAQGVTRPRYQYTWSWADAEETKPGLVYGGDKVHARHGYRWKHPVHEVITTDRLDEVQGWFGFEIHHHPDNTKSRGQYFPLLELSTKEDPTDDRNAFYLAREYYFYNRIDEATKEFLRHLSLPSAIWPPERAASYRYLAKCQPTFARDYLESAIKESPGRREALVELSQYFYGREDWQNCYWRALEALEIIEKPLDYLCEEFAWNELPYDLAAIAAHNLGFKEEALKYGEKAAELNPADERLGRNVEWYKANL